MCDASLEPGPGVSLQHTHYPQDFAKPAMLKVNQPTDVLTLGGAEQLESAREEVLTCCPEHSVTEAESLAHWLQLHKLFKLYKLFLKMSHVNKVVW